MYCWRVVYFHETSSCQNPCCFFGRWPFGEKSPRNLLSFKFCYEPLMIMSQHTENFRAFSTAPFPFLVISLVRGSWFWKRVSDDGKAVCWSCLAPTKDHDTVFAGLVEVSGAGASPPTLNCRWVRWWAEVLWATQEDPCYLQVPDRSYKLHGILQQRLQLPPGTWQTSRTLWQVKLVRAANCSSSSPGTYKLFQLHQRSL